MARDVNAPASASDQGIRYGKLPEIHHIFRGEQKSPNIVISTVFAIGSLAALPVLLGAVSRILLLGFCYKLLTVVVALPWRKCQSLPESYVRCAYRTRLVPWLSRWLGGHTVHVLFKLELVSDLTSTLCSGHDILRQWKSSIDRSSR